MRVVENFSMRNWSQWIILVTTFFITFPNENHAASPRNISQRVRSFHCVNNQFVFGNWFCDGINDCGDASDESYGCDMVKCGTGNFTCADSKCLPIAVRCNNVTDCEDGSDEKYCHHEPSLDDCIITKGKFLCADKLRCIEINRVCDEEAHCFDGSDEGGKCDDYDHEKCTTCPHACFRTPIGPQCFYNTESGTYDDVHKDITYCPVSKNNCDQKCVTYRDVNQCSCEENFTPTYTIFSSFYCEEKEKNKNWLIFTVDKGIRGIQGYSNQSTLIKDTTSRVTAIAAGNEYVYWGGTYIDRKVIEKTSLSPPVFKSDVLISDGIDEVNAIDVDWRTGNIYFIDNGKSHIAACRNDGKLCIELVALENIATSISLAPREGNMFWSMRDEVYGFVIKKADMNGLNSYNFVDEGLGDVYSIACDEAAEKLFWLDSLRRKIEVIKFNGEGRKIFKSDLRVDYLSITINARYLYWNVNNSIPNSPPVNPNNPKNIYFSAGSRLQPKIALNGSDPVLKIYGYSYSEKMTEMTPPCNWGCDNGICLMHSLYHNRTGSDCVCANSSDHQVNSWCRNTSDHYLGYHYNYDDYYIHTIDTPHRPVRIILVVCSVIFIISAVGFYLYRKGCFHGVDVFRHARL